MSSLTSSPSLSYVLALSCVCAHLSPQKPRFLSSLFPSSFASLSYLFILPRSVLSLFLAFSFLSLFIFLMLLFHVSFLCASLLLQQNNVLFPIQREVYGYILHCRILEMCDKVLNSPFLSRTRDSALSPIFSLLMTSLSFLHADALSPLLSTSWPLNLKPWCSPSGTLSPSFLRAVFVTRIPLFLKSCPALSYLLPHSPSFSWPWPVSPILMTSPLPLQPHSHCLSCLHTHFLHRFSFLSNLSFTHHLSLTLLLCAVHRSSLPPFKWPQDLSHQFPLLLILPLPSLALPLCFLSFPLTGTLVSIHLLCCAYSFSKATSFLVPMFLF